MYDNENTEKLNTVQNNKHEPHRKINIFRLIFVIILIAIFVFIFSLVVKSVYGLLNKRIEEAKHDQMAEVEPTQTPIATEEPDFYQDPLATKAPSANSNKRNQTQAATETKPEKKSEQDNSQSEMAEPDLPLYQSYDITIRNGISVTAYADSGQLQVIATDSNGEQTVIFDKTGPFTETSIKTDLPSGDYSVSIYTDAKGWKWSYNLY